jgi:diacylglycerol O-acyltransferase
VADETGFDMQFERRMSDADALMWGVEKDPLLRSTITAVAVLDRAPDRERLLDRMERTSRLIPRLRQRVAPSPLIPAPPRWVADSNFDLRYHVRFVRAPAPGTQRTLLDLAAIVAMQGFDRARPLWEFLVVEDLADGRAALIQKIHHSITDGVGGIKLAMTMLDLERDPAPDDSALPLAPPPEEFSALRLIGGSLMHELRRQVDITRGLASTATGTLANPAARVRQAGDVAASVARIMAPVRAPLSPIMTGRSLSLHFDLITAPLEETKRAAKSAGGKLNDAFLAAVAGGLRRYHERHGNPVDTLRTTMPINIRTEGTASLAGNQFVPARFLVPVGIMDPHERMAAIRELVNTQRNEPALPFTETIAGILNRLPTTVVTQIFGSMLKGVDFVTSNVPGAPVPVFLAGGRMEAHIAFAPLSGAATNVTLVSYLDDLHIGINTDAAAIPDPDVFVDCLQEGFDEIAKCA